MQARPKAILRTLFMGDRDFLQGMRWYVKMGRRVWLHEVWEFLFKTKIMKNGPTLKEFYGASLASQEYSMKLGKRVKVSQLIPVLSACDITGTSS